MDVLLICDVPDPGRDPEWFDSADLIAIHEALRALCAWAIVNQATVGVPAVPAVTAFMRGMLPLRLRREYDSADHGWEPPSELMHAVLVGGMERELTLARRIHESDIPVWPIVSTGAATLAFLDEFGGDFPEATKLRLRADLVDLPLLDTLLTL